MEYILRKQLHILEIYILKFNTLIFYHHWTCHYSFMKQIVFGSIEKESYTNSNYHDFEFEISKYKKNFLTTDNVI